MKGINFKEPLFHSVVSGTKTQTRRIVKPQPYYREDDGKTYSVFKRSEDGYFIPYHLPDKQKGFLYQDIEFEKPLYPRYKPGETLYLKEPYLMQWNDEEKWMRVQYLLGGAKDIEYDVNHSEEITGRLPSVRFMPEKYARYFVEITGVRAERLQDIGDDDCLKEGIVKLENPKITGNPFGVSFPYNTGIDDRNYQLPREACAALIDKIYGKGTWKSNPFVWVYDFKLK